MSTIFETKTDCSHRRFSSLGAVKRAQWAMCNQGHQVGIAYCNECRTWRLTPVGDSHA